MHARTPLRDRVNVQATTITPFVMHGEMRYRLTIEHGLGCRSEFVLDEAGYANHIKQAASAATVAGGLVLEGRLSA